MSILAINNKTGGGQKLARFYFTFVAQFFTTPSYVGRKVTRLLCLLVVILLAKALRKCVRTRTTFLRIKMR